MDCVVRDISEHGACVELDEAARLPASVNLKIPGKGRSFIADTIWRHAGRIGLARRGKAIFMAEKGRDRRQR
ncbi:hypothetical protein LTR94_037706, partial [Friedmanniomyces endolithicus]